MTLPPNTPLSVENVECDTCEGSGKIVEAARMHGANQHSACQMDCEDCDGTGRRPALSPPAEGSSVPGWPAGMTRGAIDDVASGRGLPPLALPMPPYHYQQTDLTGGSAVSSATPTPAPVDWGRVGPKLVEAIDPADMDAIGLWINEGEQPGLVPSGRIKALWQSVRSALAAAQQGAK